MSDDAVPLRLRRDFILETAMPTLDEIRHGWLRGWINADDARVLAASVLRADGVSAAAGHEFEGYEFGEVTHDEVDAVFPEEMSTPRYWTYMIMEWLWREQSTYAQLWSMVDGVIADLGYPDEIQGLMSFAGTRPEDVGFDKMLGRWEAFLHRERLFYQDRRRA